MRRANVLLALGLAGLSAARIDAQARPATPAQQRMQGTRNMHVACVGPDSARASMRRRVGDTVRVGQRAPLDTVRPVTGGTVRSRQFPEFDVVLDIPNVCVERIFLKVDSVTAKINLNAQVANLVK